IQHAGVLEHVALQRWVFGCYQDYNAALRHELRKLASEFIRKLTKMKQPTIQQISEYITERNWAAFLKCYMDVTDIQRMFRDCQALQVSINRDDSGESLQENFSDSECLLSDKSQYTNDLEYNSSIASDSLVAVISCQLQKKLNYKQKKKKTSTKL
ncbi:2777_t:CDS:2, partial [Cetraspora pellucida]